jgi:molybdopterin converting factor small subunit
MVTVKFTPALKRFFPEIKEEEVLANSVEEALEKLEDRYVGINTYLRDESGHLRKHINIFIDETMVTDRQHLSDLLEGKKEILIFQALSGG